MEAPHFIFSLTNSRAEMYTTDLGLAAYEGKQERIRKALEMGIDWNAEGPYLLNSAIFGHQWEIARDLLRGGMPISDSIYQVIYYWADHSLLAELPPRPDLLAPLEAEAEQYRFFDAVIEGDLEEAKVRFRPEWIHVESSILLDRLPRRPLHYAARICHLALLEFLLAAGAEVNALTGDGQSALALVSRCPGVENRVRKACFALLSKNGGKMIPPAEGWFQYWRLSRGAWRSN